MSIRPKAAPPPPRAPITIWIEQGTNHRRRSSHFCRHHGSGFTELLAMAGARPLAPAAAAYAARPEESASAGEAPVAYAKLLAGDGTARGEAKVTQAADGLHVLVRAEGLTPRLHAVHVHTTGTCTPPDFVSAGGHWNPTDR